MAPRERAVQQSVHRRSESDERLANRVLQEEDAIQRLQKGKLTIARSASLPAPVISIGSPLRAGCRRGHQHDLKRNRDQPSTIAQGALRMPSPNPR